MAEQLCLDVHVGCDIVFKNEAQREACKHRCSRRELHQHKQECPMRPASCKNQCGVRMCERDAAQHNCITFLAQELARERRARERLQLEVFGTKTCIVHAVGWGAEPMELKGELTCGR